MKKLATVVLLVSILVGCNSTGKVGDIRYSHSTYTQDVYVILRENGEEAYILDEYVEESIETYKNNGTYGKEIKIVKTI